MTEPIAERTRAGLGTDGVYLDYNATTPVAPEVLAAMLPYFADEAGNPSSSHGPGRRAASAVEQARSDLAAACGCSSTAIVFTSGATEADNLALRGCGRRPGDHVAEPSPWPPSTRPSSRQFVGSEKLGPTS